MCLCRGRYRNASGKSWNSVQMPLLGVCSLTPTWSSVLQAQGICGHAWGEWRAEVKEAAGCIWVSNGRSPFLFHSSLGPSRLGTGRFLIHGL